MNGITYSTVGSFGAFRSIRTGEYPYTEGKRIRAAREPEDLPEELETWNGIHAQITAPKGTFERIWNEAGEEDDGDE